MNEEIQNKLLGYLSKVENSNNDVVDFGSDQVPLLVQEILIYTGIEAALYATLQIISSLFFLYIGKKMSLAIKEVINDEQHYIPIVFSLMISTPFLCSALENILIVLKVYFAPRIFLLEYIREIIRN